MRTNEGDRVPEYTIYHGTANIYQRKDREIKVYRKDGRRWALIGGIIAAAYLPPQLNHVELRRTLVRM